MAYSDKENTEICKQLALELEHYTEDGWYKCPKCKTIIEWDNDSSDCDEDTYTCPKCGETFDEGDLEALSIYEYFNDTDIYNIEYRIDGSGDYRSVEVMIACGGPNIYIDTGSKEVKLHWWNDKAYYPLSSDTCNQIDSYYEELYQSIK